MNTEIVKIDKFVVECPEENGETFIPIKPICDILGISHQPQFLKMKQDRVLSSTVTDKVTVGADGKERKMTCLPLRFVFGWLFSIDEEKVKPEAKEAVIRYKDLCYNILFDHFMGPVADRRKDLTRQLEISHEIANIEKDLSNNPQFEKLTQLKKEYIKLNNSLKNNDKYLLGSQLKLF